MKNDQDKLSKETQSEYNVFRDSALRYVGYANEIGESFRYQFPRFVIPSYVMAFGYCGLDALSTGHREWTRIEKSAGENTKSREFNAARATLDTLLWQTFASVLIPGGTINIIVRSVRFAMARTAFPSTIRTWLPTAAGITSIPFIIHPIDDFVDFAMDNTSRKIMFDGKEK